MSNEPKIIDSGKSVEQALIEHWQEMQRKYGPIELTLKDRTGRTFYASKRPTPWQRIVRSALSFLLAHSPRLANTFRRVKTKISSFAHPSKQREE